MKNLFLIISTVMVFTTISASSFASLYEAHDDSFEKSIVHYIIYECKKTYLKAQKILSQYMTRRPGHMVLDIIDSTINTLKDKRNKVLALSKHPYYTQLIKDEDEKLELIQIILQCDELLEALTENAQ